MDTFALIARTRRLVWTGIVIGLLLAILIAVLRMVNSDHLDLGEILGSVALGTAVGLPAGFAWLSLDRRPGLLPVAAIAALIVGLFSITLFAPWLIPAIIWFVAARRRRNGRTGGWRSNLLRLGLPVIAAGAFAVLFVHADPFCSETLRDGTINVVDASSRGFSTGWSLSLINSGESTSTAGPEVVSTFCTSDTIVVGEALASLVLSTAALVLAGRWPVNPGQSRQRSPDSRMAT